MSKFVSRPVEVEAVQFDGSEASARRVILSRADILSTAESLVNGDRAATYGTARDSFGRIAKLWTAMGLFTTENADGVHVRELTAEDVALALVQLKVSRIISSPDHSDSWVDAAGYIALGGELATGAS